MWLHKFIPQPCFDNASAEGGTAGGKGGVNQGTSGMMMGGGYQEKAQGIPGYGTPQEAKAANYGGGGGSLSGGNKGGGGSSSVKSTPPATVPIAVKKPTISAPTLAQLTALTPKSYTAPVTAVNANTYGPNAMMSVPSVASTPELANSIANAAAVSRAKSAPPSTGNTQVGALGSSGGFSGGAAAARGLAETAASVGTPGGISGGAMASRGLDRGGNGTPGGISGGAMASRGFDGPSFSGGPQSNAGNAVLGQSRSNVMSGIQDPSTNATGYSAAPGLLSRIGEANIAQNNSVLGQAVNAMGNLTGMAPIGLLANQAQIARNQFAAENPMATNPVAEVTVNTGLLEDKPEEPDQWSEVDISSFGRPTTAAQRAAQEQTLAETIARSNATAASNAMPAEPGTMAEDRATELAKALSGNPAQQQTVTGSGPAMSMPGQTTPATRSPIGYQGAARQVGARAAAQSQANSETVQNAVKGLLSSQPATQQPSNPYGTPAQRDTNAGQSAYGSALAGQQRMAQAQAATNAIRQGLLSQQAPATSDPASAPTNQEMPGSVRDNLKDFSVVQGLLDNIRQGALGGAPTQQQPETDAEAARMERAIQDFRRDQQGRQDTTDTTAERVASVNPQDQATSSGTTASPGINKASGLKRAGTRTMQTVNGLVVHHTGGRGDVNSVIKTLNSRGLGVQFVVDRNGQIHQLTNEPNSIAYHTLQSSRNPTWNGPDISNETAVGVEVIAKNDADVTQAQIEATARLGQWLSSQPFASENFAVVGHGAYQGGPGAAGRYGRSGKQADEGKRASEYYNSLSDEKKSQLNALMSGQIGGDIEDVDTGLVEGFLNAALSDEEAQAFLDQQGYSKTEEGKWTDGAKSFDTPMEAVKNLPLLSQLTLLVWWTRGGTPPPSRDGTNRGGGEWRPPGLLSASMGGPVTQPGNDNAGGGGPFVNGAGNWTPPGLLTRPYSNPWATRNPWLNV